MTSQPEATREAWLQRAIGLFRPWFTQLGAELPASILVSVGFPSTGARSNRIGECWTLANPASAPHVFIHPRLGEGDLVLAVLLHELVHASGQNGHGAGFKRLAVAVGLTGKMTATVAGEALTATLTAMLDVLGPYPHRSLPVDPSRKKQTTRNLKLVVRDCCGYQVRTTRKWLDEQGLPLCPHGQEMELEDTSG
ncbi:transcription elongation protein SprT [Acrocarpospora sp. B8E8]|uniref:transcription elongation protein SprT n=1 Tax=Acrocarpospora sp. B8E8 TaxID=3153572 RepID=UPI00325E6F69